MIRTPLFIIAVSVCAGVVSVPASSAFAESGKGLFGFFNRSQSEQAAPVHMTPGVQGSSGENSAQPLNLGKKAKMAREEDSPVYEEQRRNQKIAAEASAREWEMTKARTEVAIAEMQAHTAYNEQVARQAQMQKIAQLQKDALAGVASRPAQTPQQYYPQNYTQSVPATAAEPVAETDIDKKPVKEPRKPRHFFNRTE